MLLCISSHGAHTTDVGGVDFSSAAMILSEDGGESSEHLNNVYKVVDPVIYNGELTGTVSLVGQVSRELLLFIFIYLDDLNEYR